MGRAAASGAGNGGHAAITITKRNHETRKPGNQFGRTIVLARRESAWHTTRIMRRTLISAAAATLILLFGGGERLPQANTDGPSEMTAIDDLVAEDCIDDVAAGIAQAARRLPQEGGVTSDEWPPNAIGGVIPPIRSVSDPFPTFDGIALDTVNDKVIFSDENRHSLLVYDRTAGGASNDPTEPVQWVFGPKTRLGYIAGVEVDPKRREFYTVNNDSGDLMTVFSYDDHGNVQPRRTLALPHQSWDVSLAPRRDEIVITVQQSNALSFYTRGATGTSPPIRTIRGLATELEDPHGTYFDEAHNEIITANHGNWTQIRPYTPYDPMGIDVDLTHDEIAVANYGDSSVRIFRRGDKGSVQPVRVLRGALTQIVGPVSVAIDTKHDELWG